jgi:hypothetical protein
VAIAADTASALEKLRNVESQHYATTSSSPVDQRNSVDVPYDNDDHSKSSSNNNNNNTFHPPITLLITTGADFKMIAPFMDTVVSLRQHNNIASAEADAAAPSAQQTAAITDADTTITNTRMKMGNRTDGIKSCGYWTADINSLVGSSTSNYNDEVEDDQHPHDRQNISRSSDKTSVIEYSFHRHSQVGRSLSALVDEENDHEVYDDDVLEWRLK